MLSQPSLGLCYFCLVPIEDETFISMARSYVLGIICDQSAGFYYSCSYHFIIISRKKVIQKETRRGRVAIYNIS